MRLGILPFRRNENDRGIEDGLAKRLDKFAGVVLTRRGASKIVVLADRCTDCGGPLHQGTLEGGCIFCAWRGSRFASDGPVGAGPTTRPAAAYKLMVADGQVQIRRADEPRTPRMNPVGR